jgi:hypothetical protein
MITASPCVSLSRESCGHAHPGFADVITGWQERRRPRFSGDTPRGAAAFHTTDRGSTAVNRNHAPPTPPSQPISDPWGAADPWRDAQGTHIPLQSRVEQVTVDTEHGALPSRLHQQGQVVGRGTYLLYVIFDHGNQLVALRPHLVRVLETRHDR